MTKKKNTRDHDGHDDEDEDGQPFPLRKNDNNELNAQFVGPKGKIEINYS